LSEQFEDAIFTDQPVVFRAQSLSVSDTVPDKYRMEEEMYPESSNEPPEGRGKRLRCEKPGID
jgi:hypothetical protein